MRAVLGAPIRLVGGVMVVLGFGVVGLGLVLIGVGRGEGFATTCYRVGQSLR